MARRVSQPQITADQLDPYRADRIRELHPPSAIPKENPRLAQDEGTVNNILAWAAADYIYSAFKEGTTFLGYPYLAVLAQRAEYRVAVETLASEMTREWIEFETTGEEEKTEQIKQIEDELKRLHVREAFDRWYQGDGFFGRGHLYLEVGGPETGDDRDELKKSIGDGRDDTSKEKVSKTRRLTAVRPIEAVWCYPTNYESNDPLKADWYKPNTWHVMGKEVHRTRLLTLVSREVPDLLKPAYSFGGLSLSQMMKPYVDNWLRTRQSIADLVHNFSVMVLATDVSGDLEEGGRETLDARVDLFNKMRDNRGTFVIDKDSEDFKNVSAPISGLEGLQAQAQEHQCAVSQIPAVKLLGIQPQGFNASSEGEVRTFYDRIKAAQEKDFREPLTAIIGFVQLSLHGKIDPDITFKFVDLWQLDEAGSSAVEKTKADIDDANVAMGAIDASEVRERLAKDPKSIYRGVDLSSPPPEPPEAEEPEPGSEEDDPGGGVPNTGAHKPNGRVAQMKPKDPGNALASGITNRAARFGGAGTGGFKGDAGVLRLAKTEVGYQHPAGGAEHCGICEHFAAPDRCMLVAGPIDDRDVCKLWKALPSANAA